MPGGPSKEDKDNSVMPHDVDGKDCKPRVEPLVSREDSDSIPSVIETDEKLVGDHSFLFSANDVATSPEDSSDIMMQQEEKQEDHITTSFDARQYLMSEKESSSKQSDAVVAGIPEDNRVETVIVEEPCGVNDRNESIEENRDQASEKRRNFESLQEHIDTLTTERMDLSLCLQQQTSIVQRLTQENENMVKRLNDAAIKQEELANLSKQHRIDEDHMQQEMKTLQKKLDSREKENRDLSSKVKVLGNELIMLEEKLLREKNQRLKQDFRASTDRESESRLTQEIESSRRDNDLLQSIVADLREQLDNTQQLLRKSDMERRDAIETQLKISNDLETAMKQRDTLVPLPKSAILSADAMNSYAKEESQEEPTSIPPEIKALLPAQTWIPGIEDFRDDMKSVSERLYQILETVDKKLGGTSEMKA